MTQTTRAAIASNISTKLADNTTGDITPQDHREVATDNIDSVVLRSDAAGAPAAAPEAVGDLYADITAKELYGAVDTTAAADYRKIVAQDSSGNFPVGPFVFDAAATVGASEDNYVVTYDHSTGLLGLEENISGGGGGGGYTQAEIEDFAGGLFSGNTESLITATYETSDNTVDLTVEPDLSLYDNTTSGFVTAGTAPVTSVAGKTGAVVLAAADIASGTLADARVSESSVTQHESALSIASTQMTGQIAAGQIADEAVSLGKLQHIGTDSILGRDAAGTGDVDILSASAARTMLGADAWGDAVDANIIPDTDGTRDLGSTSTRFDQGYVDELHVTEGIVLTEAADHPVTPAAGLAQLWIESAATQTVQVTFDDGIDAEVLTDRSGSTLTVAAITTSDALIFGDASDADNMKQRDVSDAISDLSLTTASNTQTLTNKSLTDPKIAHTVNSQTGTTYTLVLADQGKIIEMNNASANTLTIPTNASVALPVGTIIQVWQEGAGTTTLSGATGVTLKGNGGSVSAGSCDIQTRYGGAVLTKVATNTWRVGGDIDTVA